MPIVIVLFINLTAVVFIVSAAILYWRALSATNGLNPFQWNRAWKGGTLIPLPHQAMLRYRLLWVATMICWSLATNDWRFRLVFSLFGLLILLSLWFPLNRDPRKSSLSDGHSVLTASTEK